MIAWRTIVYSPLAFGFVTLCGIVAWISGGMSSANFGIFTNDEPPFVAPTDPAPGAAFVRSVLSPTREEITETREGIAEQRREFERAEAFLRRTIAETAPGRLAEELRSKFVERKDEWPCHLRDAIRVALMEVESPDSAWRVPAQLGWIDDDITKRLVTEKPDFAWLDEVSVGLVFAGRVPAALRARRELASWNDESWKPVADALASLGETGFDGASVDQRIDVIAKLQRAFSNCMFDLAFESMLWRVFEDCQTDLERARVLARIGAAIDGDSEHDPSTSRSVRANVAAARLLADGSDRELLGTVLCAIATEYGNESAGKKRDDRVACALSSFVSDECPKTSAWGVSTSRAGQYERRFGNPQRAIEFLLRIFPSDIDDLEPGGHVMVAYQNYRHSAAIEISKCHEALGDFASALDWRKRARDEYTYRSWCGTCIDSETRQMEAEIARLQDRAEGRR